MSVSQATENVLGVSKKFTRVNLGVQKPEGTVTRQFQYQVNLAGVGKSTFRVEIDINKKKWGERVYVGRFVEEAYIVNPRRIPRGQKLRDMCYEVARIEGMKKLFDIMKTEMETYFYDNVEEMFEDEYDEWENNGRRRQPEWQEW